MKGIIFTEFYELVESAFGMDMLDDIIDACDLPSGGTYTAVGTYDHAEIAALVTALSEKAGVAVPELLKTYGSFLFGRFTKLYPDFFQETTTAFAFLESVENTIHVEVRKLYPKAELPSFDTERPNEDTLVMVYRSTRHLEDVAHGLILGCLEHFGETCDVEKEDGDSEADGIRFTLTKKAA